MLTTIFLIGFWTLILANVVGWAIEKISDRRSGRVVYRPPWCS